MVMLSFFSLHGLSQSANTKLSILVAPTAIKVSLLPSKTNTVDLGSATLLWRNGWFPGDVKISGLTVGRGSSAVRSNTALGNSALFSNTTG